MVVENESVYRISDDQKKEIDKKLKELLGLCQIARIPMFASCAIASDHESTEYLNIVYSAQSHAMRLHDDRIRKHMLIASGSFDAVPKRETVTFDPFGVLNNE